jgi:hypothetical protein
VTVSVSISFGILDIPNIAHPAFIILSSYTVDTQFGVEPIVASIVALPVFYELGAGSIKSITCLQKTRPGFVARPRVLFRHTVHQEAASPQRYMCPTTGTPGGNKVLVTGIFCRRPFPAAYDSGGRSAQRLHVDDDFDADELGIRHEAPSVYIFRT